VRPAYDRPRAAADRREQERKFELLAACSIRAAKSSRPRRRGAAGTAYTLSTLSGCRLEDGRAATTGLAWYPLYLCGGHDVARAGIARAKAAGFSVLVVTLDTPTAGLREKISATTSV
jgi:isopentenyl diphosphate isomerase/L-lactate dehydrogenase-like FMN-dependent dehydrogenase